MISAVRLKSNLQFNKNLGELIEVMKLAATLQFNQLRQRAEPPVEFIRLLEDVFSLLVSSGVHNDLLSPKENLPSLLLLVSSDEGFLGELNFLLVNRLFNARKQGDLIAVVGQQGANYLKEIQINFSFFDSPGDKIDRQSLVKVRDHIFKQYLDRKVGKVYAVFSRFLSLTNQQAELVTLLPLTKTEGSSIRPLAHLLIEPDAENVIEGWIKSFLDFRLFHIFWWTKLAESAARIMHLESSVQELNKINTHLRMEYFKYLHGLSDKSIRELSASRLIEKEE